MWLVEAKLSVLRYDGSAARLQVQRSDAPRRGNDVENRAAIGRPARVVAAIAADFLGGAAFGRYQVKQPLGVRSNDVNHPRPVRRDNGMELVGRTAGDRHFRTAVQILDVNLVTAEAIGTERQLPTIPRDRWVHVGCAFLGQADRRSSAPSSVSVQCQAPNVGDLGKAGKHHTSFARRGEPHRWGLIDGCAGGKALRRPDHLPGLTGHRNAPEIGGLALGDGEQDRVFLWHPVARSEGEAPEELDEAGGNCGGCLLIRLRRRDPPIDLSLAVAQKKQVLAIRGPDGVGGRIEIRSNLPRRPSFRWDHVHFAVSGSQGGTAGAGPVSDPLAVGRKARPAPQGRDLPGSAAKGRHYVDAAALALETEGDSGAVGREGRLAAAGSLGDAD